VPEVEKPSPKQKFTTKARKLENTKKGEGVYETLFFRAFVLSCFRDGCSLALLATSDLQQATCYMRRTTDYGQLTMDSKSFISRDNLWQAIKS